MWMSTKRFGHNRRDFVDQIQCFLRLQLGAGIESEKQTHFIGVGDRLKQFNSFACLVVLHVA